MTDQELYDQHEELLARLEKMCGPWTYKEDYTGNYWERKQVSNNAVIGFCVYDYTRYCQNNISDSRYVTAAEAMVATDAWLLSQGKVLIGGVP